jgi:hypothetical protein
MTILDDSLVAGDYYDFRVVATNSVGDSAASSTVTKSVSAVPDKPD